MFSGILQKSRGWRVVSIRGLLRVMISIVATGPVDIGPAVAQSGAPQASVRPNGEAVPQPARQMLHPECQEQLRSSEAVLATMEQQIKDDEAAGRNTWEAHVRKQNIGAQRAGVAGARIWAEQCEARKNREQSSHPPESIMDATPPAPESVDTVPPSVPSSTDPALPATALTADSPTALSPPKATNPPPRSAPVKPKQPERRSFSALAACMEKFKVAMSSDRIKAVDGSVVAVSWERARAALMLQLDQSDQVRGAVMIIQQSGELQHGITVFGMLGNCLTGAERRTIILSLLSERVTSLNGAYFYHQGTERTHTLAVAFTERDVRRLVAK